MPNVQWEWKISPQTLISGLNLLVMLGGIVSILVSVESDIKIAQAQVSDLRIAVTVLAASQQQQAIDAASTKAKVDLILPMVEKIGDTLSAARK